MRKIHTASSPERTDSVVSQFCDLSFLPGSLQWSQTLEFSDLLRHIQQLVAEVAEVSACKCSLSEVQCSVCYGLKNVLCNVLLASCAGYQPLRG